MLQNFGSIFSILFVIYYF